MKFISSVAHQPLGLPLLADDVIEFHVARLLLLVRLCGTNDRIDGLTKLAKLDFFVRYPAFFTNACRVLGATSANFESDEPPDTSVVESSMIRYHYGPWDRRYYQVLAYMTARGLLDTVLVGKTVRLHLTVLGREIADVFASDTSYVDLVVQMRNVKVVFGSTSGSKLKGLVYQVFNEEVALRRKGEVIASAN